MYKSILFVYMGTWPRRLASLACVACLPAAAGASTAAPAAVAGAPLLSKSVAWDELKKNGLRWQQTLTLRPEAEAKRVEAESALSLKVGFVAQQFGMHTNPNEYGIPDHIQGINWIFFGSTGIELEATLLDLVERTKIAIARTGVKIADGQSREFQTDLTALMLLQFLETQRLKRELMVIDSNLERDRVILKLAKSKIAAGAGIPLDVAKAKSLTGADTLKRASTYTKFIKTRQGLALLIGREKPEWDVEALRFEPVSETLFDHALENSLRDRADLRVASLNAQSAAYGRDEAKRRIWPKVTLLGSTGIASIDPFGMGNHSAFNGFAGIKFMIPLWSGGLMDAERQKAEAISARAELQLKQTHLMLLSEVKAAFGSLLNARQAIVASEDYVTTAQDESRIAEQRYYSGASNLLELASAHANLIGANDSNTEAIYSYEKAKIGCFHSMGNFDPYFTETQVSP